jgi:hypothetical protein
MGTSMKILLIATHCATQRQIVTISVQCEVGLSLHSITHPLFMSTVPVQTTQRL